MEKMCRVPAYEGNEKYIFFSYCHQDNEAAFRLIEKLTEKGYRIWYDDGIRAGEDWPEVIARHLDACTVFLAFLTENAANSHNCRKEITFALEQKKQVVAVKDAPIQLSLGMQMQLSTSHMLFRYEYASDEEFLAKLSKANGFADCGSGQDRPPEKLYCIRAQANGDFKYIESDRFVIGRSETNADFIIKGNKTVSREHAIITHSGNTYYIKDNNSTNGTKVNGKRLDRGGYCLLKDGDTIYLSGEYLQFLLIR